MSAHSETKWIDQSVVYAKCPKCKTGFLDRRVSRSPLVKYSLFWTDVKRFRCNYCYKKVYVIGNK